MWPGYNHTTLKQQPGWDLGCIIHCRHPCQADIASH
jgi:hypothetical protein